MFALAAFVIGAVGQELWRGVRARRAMSGAIAVQTSRRQPAFNPTSLVASPSKKREIGPRSGAEDGKNDFTVRMSATWRPSRVTRSCAPRSIRSRRPFVAARRSAVGLT